MSYSNFQRVIPRDFFNEAKLLKCYGVLALAIHKSALPTKVKISIEESGEPFDIVMADGYGLTVKNYPITVNGEIILFYTTYNSKDNFPFYCQVNGEEVEVFDNLGDFTMDFRLAFR